jgi:hypothetical protein
MLGVTQSMDARLFRAVVLAASLLSLGAGYRTQNFLVTAPTAEFARQVADSAEDYRHRLAVEWLGEDLPAWTEPCPISVHVGPQLGAGGATSFTFIGGQPTRWTMTVQGSAERILDSVLPHEVTHTIFATHFGRPLPRWADEGACTTVEHSSERDKQHRLLYEFLTTGRGIAFNQMFAMKEYPPDVLPLYSQGYSLARFLIAQGGKRKFVDYVGDGMKSNNWTNATQQHYNISSLSQLQTTWVEWVRRGCPELDAAAHNPNTQLVSHDQGFSLEREAGNGRVQMASTAGGWYARVRDGSRGRQLGTPPQAQNSARSAATNSSLDDPSSPQTVTRPQPIERAQLRVIEWTQAPQGTATPQTIWR